MRQTMSNFELHAGTELGRAIADISRLIFTAGPSTRDELFKWMMEDDYDHITIVSAIGGAIEDGSIKFDRKTSTYRSK
jgi:hypothetical protein